MACGGWHVQSDGRDQRMLTSSDTELKGVAGPMSRTRAPAVSIAYVFRHRRHQCQCYTWREVSSRGHNTIAILWI